MKAFLKNYHQSPRKTRLVADFIRGKSVARAKHDLAFLPKRATGAIEKLLDSAVSNAKELGVSEANLYVKTISVNKGQAFKRYRPFARGRAGSIHKTMSHITLELGAQGGANAASAGADSTEKSTAKKAPGKKVAKKAAKKTAKKAAKAATK